jgi:hypothetical protein
MPSSKRSTNHTEGEEEEETEPKNGTDNSGAFAATFVFGLLGGAVALWLLETFDANEKRKENAERPK